MEEGLIKKLATSLKCTACGKYYESASVDIVGHESDLWFFKAACTSCHAEFLVAAVLQEFPGPEPESRRGRLNQTGTASSITADDLLAMHDFLRDFNGDFSSAFRA